jgi:putative membrane protein
MTFGSEAGDRAFTAAIKSIESGSSAEVVVAVREHARRWFVQHAIVGVVAAVGVLVYAAVFRWNVWAILAFPLISGALAIAIVEYVAPLHRALVPSHVRDRHVLDAARALFVARNMHATRDRTGLLVYLAVHPRACELVGDLAVVDKLGEGKLDAMADKLAAAIPDGAEATAKVLASFAPELAAALPVGPDDRDELPDAPIVAP